MKSNIRFTAFGSKFLLMCILLHFSGALPGTKLSAAPPPKDHGAEAKADSSSKSAMSKAVSLPLFFEANKGQTDPRVRFLTRSAGYMLFLTPTETVLAESKTQIGKTESGWGARIPEIKSTAGSFVRMQLLGANPSPAMTGLEELPGKVNYLLGSDSANWQTGVSLFSKVRTEQVYPGVDLLFHGDDKQLEYDFIVAPGADPSKIVFRIRGAARIEIDAHGDLVLHTSDSDFRMHKPVIYQTVGSERRLIAGNFIRKGRDEVAFRIGQYDHGQSLVIDPVIHFASFLGGNGVEETFGIAVDDTTPTSPKLYIAGATSDSTSFGGTTPLPFKVIGSGTSTTAPVVSEAGFIAKIDTTTTGAASLDYLTFVGGKTPFQAADGSCFSVFEWLALDKSQGAGNVVPVIGGGTNCKDFPASVVLNPETGAAGHDISSTVTRMMPSGSAIDLAALLGGNQEADNAFISVSSAGNIVSSGATRATNMPTVNPYVANFNNGAGGHDDCYVAVLDRTTMSIIYATYINSGQGSVSGSPTGCGGFEDSAGNLLIGGNTVSGAVFDLGAGGANLANGFQKTFCPGGAASCPGTTDVTFALKLNPNLVGVNQLQYATYYGGGGSTRARNGSFDLGNGVVAIVGSTTSATTGATSPPIPLNNQFQSTNNGPSGGQTGYLLVLNTNQTAAASLLMSTFIGGTSGNDVVRAVSYDAADPTSFRIVIAGETASTDFPILNGLQPFEGGAGVIDAFISVLKVPQPGQAAFNASLYFSTFIGSGATTTVGGQFADNERIDGLAVDSNHTIYATGYALSSSFFGFTNPATTVNGFQTSCTSCGLTPPIADTVVFTIGTGGSATLTSITVSPSSATIGQGKTQQFKALGFFSDGTVQDLTDTATWASTATNIATISNTTGTQGLATASSTNTGSTNITAAQGGVTSAAATLTVATPTTISFDILGNNTSGGTVVDDLTPHLIDCFTNGAGVQSGTCSAGYTPGTVVTFTETTGAGAKFNGWSSQCATGTGGTTPTCTINVPSGPIGAITATYGNGTGTFPLTLALPASGDTGNGVVNSGITGGGIDCKFVGAAPPAPIAPEACSNPGVASGQIVQLIPESSDPNSTFVGWAGTCPFQLAGTPNDCFVTMSQSQTVTPVFTAIQITLNIAFVGNGTVTSDIGGINCSNPPVAGNVCKAVYTSGTTVTLTESPGTGYSFASPSGWSPAFCGINSTATTCILGLTSSNEPSGSLTMTATFTINSYLLNVSTEGGNTGGTVTSNANNLGGTINCGPNNLPANGCALFEQFNWPVTLTETPQATATFTGWAASGVPGFVLPASCTTGAPKTCSFAMPVTPAGGLIVTASFAAAPQQFALTVTDNGTGTGTVTSQIGLSPAINCSDTPGGPTACSQSYNSGTIVTLTGMAATGSTFTGFSGDCAGTGTCNVMMSQARNVTATFNVSVAPVTLTVTVSGANGSVVDQNNAGKIQCSITGGVVTGTCSAPYNPGTQVSLQATGGTGSSFNGWTAGPCADSSTDPCAFTITTNTNATATFTAATQTFTLLVNEAGSGSGTVASQTGLSPAINCTGGSTGCSATYNSGTLVTLTATPTTGSTFMGWVGGAPACTGTGTCSVTMNQSQSVTAIFNTTGPVIIADWDVTGGGDNDKQRIDGKSSPLLVKLTNTSATQTVHITGVSADNAAYKVTTTCATLGPGQSCTVSSSFTATSLCQVQNTMVTVADDDPAGNFTFTIEGFGADSGLQVDDLTNPSNTPQSLAQSLVGPGVTISNVTYTGAKRAAGTFTSSSNIIGFNSGIVLSTGSVRNTIGPNCSTGISVDNGEPGDPDLSTLAGGATNDAAVLQFDFVPTSSSVSFQYVFGSDEYPEFVNQFNDTFAFFLNGTNIALIPGTNLPVTINDVNGSSNPQFFINNNFQFPAAAPVDTELDGLTVVFTAQAQVTPGNTYHIKLAIADALDFALDSNVFIKAGSLSSSALSFSPSSVAFGNQPVGVPSAGMPVTLTNNGTTAVNISGIAATPPFGETNNCPAQLAPTGQTGSSCTITVTITPSSATSFTGSLTVTSNSPTAGSQQSIPLSGTGTSTGAAVLSISKSHTGNFTQGQQGSKYTVTVSNATGAGATSGAVSVADSIPSGLTLVSMAGTGWSCGSPSNPPNVCSRSDALAGGMSYPAITVTVNVAANAASPQVNSVAVSGGGSAGATASDSTTINTNAAVLSITKTHTGSFLNGQQGATYTVTVSNATGAGPTSGTVTVTDAVPDGLTLVSIAGTGWTCGSPNPANVCTRTDALAGGASYPAITVTVNVSANATSPQVNSVTVSGGGSASATANDSTTITNSPVIITVAPPPPGTPSVPVINPGGAATYGLVLTSQPGFSGTITLSCTATTSTGAPASQFITCAPDPGSVTIKPGGTTQVAIVLNTYCSRNVPLDMPAPGGPAGLLIVALTALALASVTWMYRRRPRWVLTFAALAIATYSIVGCGSTPSGPAGRTPAGTYNLALSFRVNGGPPIPGPLLQLIIK